MNLVEAIEGAKKKQGLPCSVGTTIKQLSKADAADLVAVLADPRYQHSQISRGLKDLGYKVPEGQVMRHRGTDCSCAK